MSCACDFCGKKATVDVQGGYFFVCPECMTDETCLKEMADTTGNETLNIFPLFRTLPTYTLN